jgi:transcription termination factor Rho
MRTFCMTTVTGILEWPQRAEGRVRQLNGSTLVQRDDDPFVPLALGERYKLRNGLEVTVTVGLRHRQPHGRPQQGPQHGAQGGPGGPQMQPPKHPLPHRGWGRGPHPQQRTQPQPPPQQQAPPQQQGPPQPQAPRPGDRQVVENIVAIEGIDPEAFARAKPFEELTVVDPQPRLTLEHPGCSPSCRLIDLFCPLGRGQRGLIVSPPKAGKTTLLKDIAGAILKNHPDVEVWVLLVDERPEEVTDFRRTFAEWMGTENGVRPRCRVVGSSNDHDADVHIAVAMMTIERCKRIVEAGRHVVVLMDSLTRLGRAFNRSKKYASSGRTLSGGIDSRALEIPKQLFGAARNTEEAGSLTIIASCLVDTGSAGDQVIFEEFKGTGNMELILDRKISERRLFPAINLAASGTRKEHLLQPEQELKTIGALRRRLMNAPPHVQIEQLLAALQRFPTNAALVGSAAG